MTKVAVGKFEIGGHFKLDFEFISWISKLFQNGFSYLCSYFQMAITSLFQLQFAHRWSFRILTSRGSKKYVECLKWTLENAPNFSSNSKYMLPLDFEFQISIKLNEFVSCLIVHVCMPSFFLHNDQSSSLKLMASSSCISWNSMSLDSLNFSFNP